MDKWSNAPLVDVAYVNMGQSPNGSTINDEKNGMPFLQGCADFGTKHPFERVWCSKPTRIAKAGDLLLSVRAPVGDTNIANQEYCIGRGLAAIRFNVLDGNFGAHAFSRDTHYLYIRSQGSTFQAVNRNDVESFPMFFPVDLDEQRRIAAVLTAADEAIDASSALVEKYAAIKQGLMQDLFSMSERVRLDSGIVQINPYCREKRPDLFYYIDLEAIIAGEITKDVIISRNEAPSRAQRLLKPKDILFQMVRPYQQNNYLFRKERELKTVASTGYAQIRTDNNEVYVYYALHQNEFVREVNNRSTGSSYPAINPTELGKCSIRFEADRAKQDEIAQILTAADERLTAERERLMKLEYIKRGLMDDLLTNRVSTDQLQGGI